jgi:hypothetical protein
MGWHRRCQARLQGVARLVKMFQHQRHGVFFAAVLLPPLDATLHAMLVRAGLWAAVCGPDGVWPCGGVWPRELRVEGRSWRRRPKMAVVAIVLWECNQ